MPWVKEFDEDAAVTRAMKIFWAKGYHATSMSDLVAAMNITKGSIYNAFESKEALFALALLQYDREHRVSSLAQLDQLDAPFLAIQTLFDSLIEQSQTDVKRRGCLLVNTALELPNQTKEIQRLVTLALLDFESFFLRTVLVGQNRHEIAVELDPKETAQWLLAQVVGLRVLARGAFQLDRLKSIRSQVLIHLSPRNFSMT
jgi:TetR/AcrR family transcriptional regulator, transcriptional repressor for nem operon